MVFKTITKEIALIGACYLTFALAKNFTDPSPVLTAVANGWSILRIESTLALNWEPFVQQAIGKISMGALIATTYFYVAGMWLGLIAMALFMFLRDRVAYIDLRRTFVISMALGAIVFALFPLAPPRFMPGLGMTDTVTMLGLDPAPNSDSAISYNRFAAMPSLHYAWALLIMTAMFRIGGLWLKIGGFVYQALMFIAIIATANHYVLDAIAGAILLMVAMQINRWWNRYDQRLNTFGESLLAHIRDLDQKWRKKMGIIEVPDFRHQLMSDFMLKDGYAIQSSQSKIVSSTMKRPNTSHQLSFRPELNYLSFVLN